MKKIWAGIYKALKMGLLSYALLLCAFSGLTGIAGAYAMSSGCILLLCSSEPTPTPTPTPNPTPTSTPTPTINPTSTPTSRPMPTLTSRLTPTPTSNPTPMSTATQPPKATSSPQVSPNPSQVVLPISTRTAGTSSTATTVNIPASASATVVTVNPNQTTEAGTDTTPTNRQLQGAEDTNGSVLLSSLSIGALLFLLAGGMLWLLWKRQRNQHKSERQGIFGTTPASRWISSRELQSNVDVSQYESSTIFVPQVSGGAGVLPMLDGTQPMSSSQSAYASNNPQPMVNNFPQHMLTMSSNNRANYPKNDTLRSPLMGSLNQPTEAGDSNKDGQMSLLANSPAPLRDTPTQFMPSSLLLPEVPQSSVEDDPMLGAAMRQAQMELFTFPDR